MFRTRKEDSLFDNTTDPNDVQIKILEPSAASSAAPAASSAPATSAPVSATTAPRPVAEAPRPITSAPTPAVAPATSFRPSAAATLPNTDLQRNRLPEAPKAAAPAAGTAPAPAAAARPNQRVLTVGNDILLKGEIATCDRLVIEGKVDATLNDVHTVEIAETGSFKGSANIEDAEISGLFEGDLVVRGRLVIYATGKVRGKISYGEIEIERGGELTGEIKIAVPTAATGRKEKAA